MVSASFGIVTVTPEATEMYDCRPVTLLEQADQALYEAKHAGRNRAFHANLHATSLSFA
jgi:PleD family two-component response regulator